MRLVGQVLNAYLADGIIALHLANRHHFNTGITLDCAQRAFRRSPEPASLVLLGSGFCADTPVPQQSR
jgi:hypothetical protein